MGLVQKKNNKDYPNADPADSFLNNEFRMLDNIK
ncbi:hypothetical protein VO54_03863 [Elizabethkingia miricola]|nr:hypothetical protein VO54_03863 [Elizabethkingia miricola]